MDDERCRLILVESALINSLILPDMVKQYRKLDDQIIVRLNRAAAQLRDQDRLSRPVNRPLRPR